VRPFREPAKPFGVFVVEGDVQAIAAAGHRERLHE
jgi:hypothetical protein